MPIFLLNLSIFRLPLDTRHQLVRLSLLVKSAAPAVHLQHGPLPVTAQHEAEPDSLSKADPALPLDQAAPAGRHQAAPALPSYQAAPASIPNPAPKSADSANDSSPPPTTVSTVTTPITAASAAPYVAASVTRTSTTPVSSTSSNSPEIFPSRPVRPFCPPDKNDPLRELPYFIDDLSLKVHVMREKGLKVKHKKIVTAFSVHAKDNPELLFHSKNYEETFMNFLDEEDKMVYKRIFKNYYNEI